MRNAAAADPLPSYVQHAVLDTAHRLRPWDDTRTICGIDVRATFKAQPHPQSHRRVNLKTYVPILSIADVPAILLCERCLKEQRIAALARELDDAALSGDEVEE